jgi:DNA polymerase I
MNHPLHPHYSTSPLMTRGKLESILKPMKTLILIDANSFIHRAYHALPPFSGPKGQPTGALYGLANILTKTLEEQKPTHVAAAFDRPEPTFRKKEYEKYKAHRPKAPDELIAQIIEAPHLFQVLGIHTFDKAGFEADDIIGTLAKEFKDRNTKIIILTGDLDTLQLIEGNQIIVETPKRGLSNITTYTESDVRERFGVTPEQLPDYKGLAGDSSDNIPGVPGIGPKTASQIIQEFGSVENTYKKITGSHKLAKKLLPHKETAILSKRLGTIRTDVPIKTTLKDLEYHKPPTKKLTTYFGNLGFKSLVNRLENKTTTSNSKKSEGTLQLKAKQGPKKESASEKHHTKEIRVAAWLLNPEKKEPDIEKLTQKLNTKTDKELQEKLESELKSKELTTVYKKIELPLIPILEAMHKVGIGINKGALESLESELSTTLKELESAIYKKAGKEFNINSPKQLGEIIFQELGITPKKKTATGQASTSEEVLEEIKDEHPIIQTLLKYRETFKVHSTYAEPLLKLSKKDGRIHTTYFQTGAATGRLSSEKPNMQNIPAGGPWAKPLRDAFQSKRGNTFIAIDYSQLELRILAHLSGDKELISAFKESEDIHNLTASKILKIPMESITQDMRRIGKTLNFGIIFGMGARALARTGNIPLKEAQIFIANYFQSFPAIRPWQEKMKEHARRNGYVETENGRKRWLPAITSSHPRFASEAERIATNMPIQGLEADIIKLAMIKTCATIKGKGWKAKLLLSIHDELLFEAPDDILKLAVKELAHCMETAYPLSVPLEVEVWVGKKWGSMKHA